MSELTKRILSALMLRGAQSPERAVGGGELATEMGIGDPAEVEAQLKALIDAGYALAAEGRPGGELRVYLTATGIITASSAYS